MEASPFPGTPRIHDALLTSLASDEAGRLAVVAFEDHLLRRFGRAEILRLRPGEGFAVLRVMADEVWTLIEGSAQLELEDTRAASPTTGARHSTKMDTPARLLLPFGVRLHVRATSPALLLRIMTHSDAEDPPAAEVE
jgi:hypothetical protein